MYGIMYVGEGHYELKVNGIDFEDMKEAPPREWAAIARTGISFHMEGPKK